MNLPAYDALMAVVKIEDAAEREVAVENWVAKWTVAAELPIRVTDLHPRVMALELAAATRAMIEAMALSWSQEKILSIFQSETDKQNMRIEMSVIRYGTSVEGDRGTRQQARLRLVPLPKKGT